MNDTMEHLGSVLQILVDLHPEDSCKALTQALAHYNEHNPTCRVEPNPDYEWRLVMTRSPLLDSLKQAQLQGIDIND